MKYLIVVFLSFSMHTHVQHELGSTVKDKANGFPVTFASTALLHPDSSSVTGPVFQKKHENATEESKYNDEKSRLWVFAGILGIISFLLTIAVFSTQKQNIKLKTALAETTRKTKEKELELERNEREKAKAEQKLEILQNMYHKRNNEIQILLLEKLGIIKDIALLNPKQTSSLKFISDVNAVISRFTMQKFVDITNELYPDFTRKLKENFSNSKLSEQETGVCCLIFCGFSNKELALFIHKKKDTQAVEKLKNRIRKKLAIPAYRDIQKFLSDNIVCHSSHS